MKQLSHQEGIRERAIRILFGVAIVFIAARVEAEPTTISANDPAIDYVGYVRKDFVASTKPGGFSFMRFDRIADMPGTGYRWDNPGTCIRFRTDAVKIDVMLSYNDLHTSTTARNSVGVYSVDGIFDLQYVFRTRARIIKRDSETVSVPLVHGGQAKFHDYEFFLPYGDSVDFVGLRINSSARVVPPKPKPAIRYVAYGDSITQGFTASAVNKTYPFLMGLKRGWATINLGWGGRSSNPAPSDAHILASLKPDVVTVLMGGNDWQGGVPLDCYRAHMSDFIANFRAELPHTPVYLMTPLWVDATWKPAARIADLEGYRQVLREIAAERKDRNLHLVEGPDLIDHDPSFFDQVAVHPNDAGFAVMAERLSRHIANPAKQP